MKNKLIVFIDSGDTIIDESTQVYGENETVLCAKLIEGADDMLKTLHEQGYTIALVADGTWDSFQNVYKENKLSCYFDEWIVSEVVGQQKPSKIMFETAMQKLDLKEEDKKRIVMVGNNLKKDIAGANRFGITSIWLNWSPRYFRKYEKPDWKPDYIVSTPLELVSLINKINDELS